jgi:hypothetical protein
MCVPFTTACPIASALYVKASDTTHRLPPFHFLVDGASEVNWSRFDWMPVKVNKALR